MTNSRRVTTLYEAVNLDAMSIVLPDRAIEGELFGREKKDLPRPGARQETIPQHSEVPLNAEAKRILLYFSAILCGSLRLIQLIVIKG